VAWNALLTGSKLWCCFPPDVDEAVLLLNTEDGVTAATNDAQDADGDGSGDPKKADALNADANRATDDDEIDSDFDSDFDFDISALQWFGRCSKGVVVWCAFFGRKPHSRLSLDPTPVRFNCSLEANMRVTNSIPLRASSLSYLTGSHCNLRRNTKGQSWRPDHPATTGRGGVHTSWVVARRVEFRAIHSHIQQPCSPARYCCLVPSAVTGRPRICALLARDAAS